MRSLAIIAILMILTSLVGAQGYGASPLSKSQGNTSTAALNNSQNTSKEGPLGINASIWNERGNRLFNRGYYNYSIYRYSNAIIADPTFVDPRNNKGVALMHLSRDEDAIESFDSALRIDPENGIIWSNKGVALLKLGRNEDALGCFNKSLEFDASNAVSWNNKGVVFAQKNQFDEALYCFNRSIDSNNFYASPWNNKGVILAKKGRYEEALHAVNNAATLRNNYTEAWINGGLILSAMGRSEKSREAFSIAKMTGYNGTARDYVLQPEPLLMMETKKKSPGFWAGMAMLALFAARCIIPRRE